MFTVPAHVYRPVPGSPYLRELVVPAGTVMPYDVAVRRGLVDAGPQPDDAIEKTAVVAPDKTSDLEAFTLPQLRERATSAGVDPAGLRKAELIYAIFQAGS